MVFLKLQFNVQNVQKCEQKVGWALYTCVYMCMYISVKHF